MSARDCAECEAGECTRPDGDGRTCVETARLVWQWQYKGFRVIELKTWREYFEAIARGTKTVELRKDDRDFRVGDVLLLREYDPDLVSTTDDSKGYTGRQLKRRVTHITKNEKFLAPGYVALSIVAEHNPAMDESAKRTIEAVQPYVESLREQFAASALAGLSANPNCGDWMAPTAIAKRAWTLADELVAMAAVDANRAPSNADAAEADVKPDSERFLAGAVLACLALAMHRQAYSSDKEPRVPGGALAVARHAFRLMGLEPIERPHSPFVMNALDTLYQAIAERYPESGALAGNSTDEK